MSPRLHQTLLITFTLIAVMVLGVLWMEFSFSFWWVFLGLPVVAITCELIFQYLIPTRCPDCKARVQCHVSSREVDDPTGHGTRTAKIINYYCPHCNHWITSGQGLNTLGAMVGFFVGSLSGMGIMIALHEELSGGIVMGLFFLCPILGFAIGSLIGDAQRAQQRRKTMTEMMVVQAATATDHEFKAFEGEVDGEAYHVDSLAEGFVAVWIDIASGEMSRPCSRWERATSTSAFTPIGPARTFQWTRFLSTATLRNESSGTWLY